MVERFTDETLTPPCRLRNTFFMCETLDMANISPDELGQMLQRKRGSMGIRAAAAEIGTSPATLSRIERGHLPDLQTLKKVCDWLSIDVSEIIGTSASRPGTSGGVSVEIAFKNKKTLAPQTAQALANLIMQAHRQFQDEISSESH